MINSLLLKIGLTKKITRAKLDKFLMKHKDAHALVLDLGCGTSAPYAKYFPNRIGFDAVSGGGVDIVGDAHRLPFENDKFDVILCTEVLEHIHSPEIAISEMKRVLKRQGKLILTTRFIFPLHDVPHDYYRYTKYGLKYLFREWEVMELKAETNTIETLGVLFQRIGFQSELLHLKPLKILFFILAKLTLLFRFVLTKEFGDISKRNIETDILSSGYYLACRKKE